MMLKLNTQSLSFQFPFFHIRQKHFYPFDSSNYRPAILVL